MKQAQEFERLYDLQQKGILTPEEFDTQRAALNKRYEMTYSAPTIGFKDAYRSYWKNSFRWCGRATRAEYWWPILGNMVITYLAQFTAMWSKSQIALLCYLCFSILFSIANIFLGFAVISRRAHDFGKSARFALFPVLTCMGLALFLALFAVAGQIVDYSTRGNPISWFVKVRSVIFIAGGFSLIIFGWFQRIWMIMISLTPSQNFPNKYGDPR